MSHKRMNHRVYPRRNHHTAYWACAATKGRLCQLLNPTFITDANPLCA